MLLIPAESPRGDMIIQPVGDGRGVVQGHTHLRLADLPERAIQSELDWLSSAGTVKCSSCSCCWVLPVRSSRAIVGSGRRKTRLALKQCEFITMIKTLQERSDVQGLPNPAIC
jgi:hypothetical protein